MTVTTRYKLHQQDSR